MEQSSLKFFVLYVAGNAYWTKSPTRFARAAVTLARRRANFVVETRVGKAPADFLTFKSLEL
jgi:hypothetical protein